MAVNELLEYLQGIDGGCAWASAPDACGAPDLNLVLCGQYYGFYVTTGGKRLNRVQRAAKASIHEAAGKVCNVRSVADLERVLGRDERRYRLHRAIPPEHMRELLTEWGKGSYRLDWLNRLIRKLDRETKSIIIMRYMDNKPIDAISREMYYDDATIYRRIQNGIDKLIEWTLEGEPPVKYIKPGWQDEDA